MASTTKPRKVEKAAHFDLHHPNKLRQGGGRTLETVLMTPPETRDLNCTLATGVDPQSRAVSCVKTSSTKEAAQPYESK